MNQKLYFDSQVVDFTSFFSSEYGFGTVDYNNGEAKQEFNQNFVFG